MRNCEKFFVDRINIFNSDKKIHSYHKLIHAESRFQPDKTFFAKPSFLLRLNIHLYQLEIKFRSERCYYYKMNCFEIN